MLYNYTLGYILIHGAWYVINQLGREYYYAIIITWQVGKKLY